MRKFDRNGDGSLDQREFLQLYRPLFGDLRSGCERAESLSEVVGPGSLNSRWTLHRKYEEPWQKPFRLRYGSEQDFGAQGLEAHGVSESQAHPTSYCKPLSANSVRVQSPKKTQSAPRT